MHADETDDQRRNRFLTDSGNGNGNGNGNGQHTPLAQGHRAASQPPHPPNSFASPPLVPASLGSGAGWGGSHGQQAHLLSSSTRSASFSSGGRFGSTFEDDELVDPDDELYDAHYGSYTQYRGRPTAGPPDLSRSRSQSLATAPVGSGRSLSSSSGDGYNPNAGIGSAANSYVTSHLYGNNAYAGHNNLYPGNAGGGLGSRYGSLGGGASSVLRQREREREDRENTSPFLRDVGALVLDDGPGSSFRELWERERMGGGYRERDLVGGSFGRAAGRYGAEYDDEDEYAHDDDGYPYTESGATSRRHSVSGVVQTQPRARMTGFAAPESEAHSHSHSSSTSSGFPSSATGFPRRGGGGGGLLLTDDDLEGALGSLSINTRTQHDNHAPGSPLMSSSTRGRYYNDHGDVARSPSVTRQQQGTKDWADSYFSPPSPLRARPPSVGGHAPMSPGAAGGGGRGSGFAGGQGHYGGPHQAQAQHAQAHLPPHPHQHPHAPPPQHGLPHQNQPPAHPHGPHQHPHPQHAHPQPLGGDMGKGIPLHAVPPDWPLYIVEFKAGRTDLFYLMPGKGAKADSSATDDPNAIRVGDLVIVEADRGKDLGKVINDSITIEEVEAYWAGTGRGGEFFLLVLRALLTRR
ncbi:hypothetical protein C8F01DRAFT_1378488 [Mycena amicta]|nr:hypothetical protein C8F01DRAFT_1378488 [Mycena amicta]